jgi:hypothetical protein
MTASGFPVADQEVELTMGDEPGAVRPSPELVPDLDDRERACGVTTPRSATADKP